ncbi:hypothetical protein [Dyadobacter sp. LHD-138]|uniref:hypothetical protein n=1 Tax=Dyadobacter sp. LHD-138 TaxID=3071413 RepID=UPI0027E1FC53|nr:hypothetical protein [Dyadobacter sp. LHD-138]MDQ6477207.1 hypothetical protein [Dyadobacter sp. LHD-138]
MLVTAFAFVGIFASSGLLRFYGIMPLLHVMDHHPAAFLRASATFNCTTPAMIHFGISFAFCGTKVTDFRAGLAKMGGVCTTHTQQSRRSAANDSAFTI